MSFQYSVNLNDTANVGVEKENILVSDLKQALGKWSQYIDGLGTLVVQLNIVDTTEGRADAAATSGYYTQTVDGRNIFAPSSLYELTTGQHVSGTSSDITVNVSPGYFQYLDLSAPLTYDEASAPNTYNPITIFLHELMHGFGQAGYYSQSGVLPSGYESTFDALIRAQTDGTAAYIGQAGDLAYGGPVQLTTASTYGENYYHLGNTTTDLQRTPSTVQDPLTLDLMNGIVFFYNYNYAISQIDLGILKDLGYNLVGPGIPLVVGIDDVSGGAGADTFSGPGGGVDRLLGNGGDDVFDIDGDQIGTIDGGSGTDSIVLQPGEKQLDAGLSIDNVEKLVVGNQSLYTTVLQLSDFLDIRTTTTAPSFSIVLQGAGGTLDLSTRYQSAQPLQVNATHATSAVALTGTAGKDVFIGSKFGDDLSGLGANDVIDGGLGDDRLDGGSGMNTVSFASVAAAVTVDLAAGTASGQGSDAFANFQNVTGSSIADALSGDAGNNVVDGGGGADRLYGFGGNDTFYVDNGADQVIEASGNGTDKVLASVSYKLSAGQEIERLQAYGTSSTPISLTGNEIANTLLGNGATNVINGGGGNDKLYGYGGNDTFYVDSAKDLVAELAGNGTDKVLASVSYKLAAGQEVEALQAYGSATAALSLTGNEIANTLLGNAGDNSLDGGGGNDKLYGYGGNDTFYVDTAGDRIIEAAGGGTDKVVASASYRLAAGQDIETLQASAASTTMTIDLTGNEIANTVLGNAAANILDGGAGIDKLYGYGGKDTFLFDTTPGTKTNSDTIGDFTVGQDMIALSHAIYGALPTGALAGSAFTTGSAATTAAQHVIYNAGTGGLFYDADGSGAGASVQFARVTSGLALDASSFKVTA